MEIKKYLTKDIIITFLVNVLLLDNSLIVFLGGVIMIDTMAGETFIVNLSILILFLLFIARIVALPMLYFLMEKYSKDITLKNFIYNLKNSNKFKIKILFITVIPALIYWLLGDFKFNVILERLLDFLFNFKDFILYLLLFSLFGSYLVLYLYWYIEDKAKAYISKQNTLLSKTVILFKLMI
ncbi:MAG: hypothetical protein ACI37S_01910 [Candidatus Gastranaerophilaceae bacterium]